MNMQGVSDINICSERIGSLATALSIYNHTGKSVSVFEQALVFGKGGAGISLAPNVLRVLDDLGVR
ncbi:hypothetical protein [Ureibacillus sp. GCM10028918]|uniref:hypothetical protein n=1 Tax=Ureibacillus sp. GCM10028918 TaxID=3273429 RepID=UPI00361EC389